MKHKLPALWHDLATRCYFKFILPAKKRATLHGIHLDISRLSPLMKNYILQGRYEFQERCLVQRCLEPKDVVLELGGAIGFIGLYCLKVIGVRSHHTIEANPRTIEMLRHNYELNGLEPQVIHAAAADTDGELSLDIGGEFWENSLIPNEKSSTLINVPSKSLQSIVAMLPQPPTALICDIEGAETQIDFRQLPNSVTRIIIELHPSIVGEEANGRLIDQLHALGFRTECVEENTRLFVR